MASRLFLLLCPLVSAFFPLHQSGEQSTNRLSGIEVEATHGLSSTGTRGTSSLSKRDEYKGDAPGIFISITPFTSNTRYRVRSSGQSQRATSHVRDNQYEIVPAHAPSQSNSLAIDQDGTDYSYFSAVGIGSKAESMYMLVDTGSSVTWVMDDSCKSGPCKMHNTFASSQSSSIKTGGPSLNLDYGTGEVSGSYANDTVSIAGMKVTIPIGLADKVSDDFQNYPFDGILGLGRTPLGGSPSTTFLQELSRSKLLPANVFGINLDRHTDGSADGELNFGGPDTSKYHGDLNWTNTVSDKSFWQIPTDDLYVDGKSVGIGKSRTAILDTGTSYMLIPPSDAKALFGSIKGAEAGNNGYWNLPCDTKVDIQVVIGGVGYSISPKDYLAKSDKGACASNIVGMSATGNDQTWLLGDTFLKNVYTVFDADKNRIGFGAKSGSSNVSGNNNSGGASSSSTLHSTAASTSGVTSSTSAPTRPAPSAGLGLPAADTKGNSTTKSDDHPASTSISTATSTVPAVVNAAHRIDTALWAYAVGLVLFLVAR